MIEFLAILSPLFTAVAAWLTIRHYIGEEKDKTLQKGHEIVTGHPGLDETLGKISREHSDFSRELKEVRYIMQSLLTSVEEINRHANPYR